MAEFSVDTIEALTERRKSAIQGDEINGDEVQNLQTIFGKCSPVVSEKAVAATGKVIKLERESGGRATDRRNDFGETSYVPVFVWTGRQEFAWRRKWEWGFGLRSRFDGRLLRSRWLE